MKTWMKILLVFVGLIALAVLLNVTFGTSGKNNSFHPQEDDGRGGCS